MIVKCSCIYLATVSSQHLSACSVIPVTWVYALAWQILTKNTPALPDRLQSVEVEIASVYCLGDTHNRDPITCMIHATLNNNKDMNPDDSIIVKMKLNIASPKEYSGSSDLKVYKMFVTGILC